MLIILLRKCEVEAEMSLVQFLESFEERDDDINIDAYDDTSLKKAVHKMLMDNYYDKEA